MEEQDVDAILVFGAWLFGGPIRVELSAPITLLAPGSL
jgi:hypothetical protein